MTNPWLARFADAEPALVAPHLHEQFEASLMALDARLDAELAAAEGGDDEFWTELGPYSGKRLRPYQVQDGVLMVPVRGVLLNGFPYQFFGLATGYEYIWKAVERGMADEDVRGIAFIHDSPGGMVAGNFDLVDRIYAMRGVKPMLAVAAEASYSASYSLASAADRIIVARTGGVGSIGVVTSHVDASKMMAEIGWKITFIHAGKHKVDGNPYEPLPDDVKARIQERVDGLYGLFVDTVARNRNLDAAAVRATEALTFTAEHAVANGLADGVGALDAALAGFAADLTNTEDGDETMTNTSAAVTVASVKADHPDVASALIAEGREAGKTEGAAAAKAEADTAMTAERARVAALDGLAAKTAGNAKAAEIISAAKADGSSAADTALKLMEAGATQQAAVLGSLQQDDAGATGATPAGVGEAAAQVPQTPEGWKAEWQGSAQLQADYPKAEHYIALKKHEAGRAGKAKKEA